MKPGVIAAVALAFAARQASAHRLDEYLQATLFSIEKDHVRADIRLTPGVAVLAYVLATIDTDGDGVIAPSEQQAYVARVMQDLSLNVDGERVPLQLVSTQFPSMQEMKDGLGEIQISLTANLPPGRSHRTLVFENHHESPIAAYLVNCLAPADPDIRVSAQNRNYLQSHYQLDYIQAGGGMLAVEWFALAAVLILGIRLAWLAMPRLLNRRTSGSAA